MNEDSRIIEKFLAGDDSAFSLLVKKYLKPVYNFVCQLSGDRAMADDIVQDAFLKAWKNMDKFDRRQSFKTWLFTIAKNTAYDYFKKKKPVPFSAFSSEEGSGLPEEIDDNILPDEILRREDLAAELDKKLEQIPAHYRLILNLCYRDDLSLAEISRILGEPYNTIKSRHGRAMKALKKVMTADASSN